MNRDIKFRAWYEPIGMFNVDLLGLTEKAMGDGRSNWVSIPFTPYRELMQFTGLHDKNGKEIYEGDICKMIECWFEGDYTEYGFIGVVKYEDGEFVLHGNGEYQYESIDKNNIRNKGIEVIGNIFENPELLTT